MDVAALAFFIWQSLMSLAGSLTFWLFILGALASGYLVAFAISRLRLSRTSPVQAAYEGAVAGFWLAFLAVSAIMYFLWRPDYVAIALALVLVVIVPWTFIAALKARSDNLEA